MNDSILGHQVALGMITSYVLEFVKNSKWFPWITQQTATLNRWISIIVAFLSSVGIGMTVTGHLSWETGATFSFTVPAMSVIADVLIHAVSQFGIQQITYNTMLRPVQPTLSVNTTTGEETVTVPAKK